MRDPVTFLSGLPFDKRNFQVVSLVRDSATENSLKRSPLNVALASPRGRTDVPAKMEELFKRLRGKTVALLGHVEGQAYVIRSGNGSIQATMSLQDVHRLAIQHHVNVIHMGCNTAPEVRKQTADFVGTINVINSVTAAKNIVQAAQSAKTQLEFMEALAGPELQLMIGDEFLAQTAVPKKLPQRVELLKTSNLEEKVTGESVRIAARVGFIGYSFGCDPTLQQSDKGC